MLFFVGPTPIHAPVPRPIVYSIGIGTSDYPDEGVTVNTSGGPPQLNVSSFLNDLSAADTSSPVRRTPVSVLSPVLQRTLSVVSPRRPRLTIESGINAVVCCSDASLNACVDTVDKEVQAVIETADGSTCYEPQVETSLSASPSMVDDTELLTPDADQSATLLLFTLRLSFLRILPSIQGLFLTFQQASRLLIPRLPHLIRRQFHFIWSLSLQ